MMNFEERVQAYIDEGGHSLPIVHIPDNISKDLLLKRIGTYELSKNERDVFKAIAYNIHEPDLLNGSQGEGFIISIDDLCAVLNKSNSSVRRALMSIMEKGFFERLSVNVNSGYGIRESKYFKLSFPDIDQLTEQSAKKEELPTFIQGQTMFAPLKRGEEVNTALMDEIITGILAPCLHLQQKGKREPILVNVVTLIDRQVKVTTRGLSGIDIAHVLDLRYYIAILSCVERLMRSAFENGLTFTETFALPISDILRAVGKKNGWTERQAVIAAINRLRSTTFELSDMPDEITVVYEIETDGGLWTIDPLSNVSFSKLDKANDQQIVSFQLPSIIASALALRAKQKAQPILRLISPVMYTEKNLLFVFLLQVRRLIQHGQMITVPWYMMRDYSSPSLEITEFKKRLSKLLSEHKGTIVKELRADHILSRYEGNINGFNIKIEGNDIILSFDPNDESLIDPLYATQPSLFSKY